MLDIDYEVARMQQMTVSELREVYADVFGERTNNRNKPWMIKRIAWRMQAKEEGGLSDRARNRAKELANDLNLRITPPREKKPVQSAAVKRRTVSTPAKIKPSRDLMPGTKLERIYKGRKIHVLVTDDGFIMDGEKYKSLTAIANFVTGKHWNGFHFFKLR